MVALWIVGIDTLGLYVWLSHRLFLLNPVWIYLSLYFVLFVLYAYAAGRVIPRIDPRHTRHVLWLIICGAVLFRLVALPSDPSLSTDMYRYVWDGRLTMHGINPFRWAPLAGTLRGLRDPLWEVMEYKNYQTIYMPISQIVFAACYAAFHNNLLGFKLVFTAFDIGVVALLLAILRGMGRSGVEVIWYAWCPLPITEVSIAGHQDVVGVFFLLLTFVLIRKCRMLCDGGATSDQRRLLVAAAVALACATMTKGIALMLFPLFMRNYGRRFALVGAVTLLYLAIPMIDYFPAFTHGMNMYLQTVHVNSSLFSWTYIALAHWTPSAAAITTASTRAIIAIVAIWAAWRPATGYKDLLRRAFIVLAVVLLVVPTLFPWYLVWVLPFLPLLGKRPSWAFVALVCTVGLLYTYYVSIKVIWWTPILEYVPFYLILLWEYVWWRLGREPILAVWNSVQSRRRRVSDEVDLDVVTAGQ